MRDAKPGAIFLKDYRPPAFLISRTELEFELHEDCALFVPTAPKERNPISECGALAKPLELASFDLVWRQ